MDIDTIWGAPRVRPAKDRIGTLKRLRLVGTNLLSRYDNAFVRSYGSEVYRPNKDAPTVRLKKEYVSTCGQPKLIGN